MTKQAKGLWQTSNLLMTLLLLSPLQSQAEDGDQTSWYIGAGLGVSQLNLETNNSGYLIDDDTSTGTRLFAGYDFNNTLSLELVVADLGEVTLDNQGNAALNPDGYVDFTMASVNLLWYFWHDTEIEPGYYREGLQLYLQGGVSAMANSGNVNYDSGSKVEATVSGGVEYGWNNGYSVRAGIDMFAEDATYLYLGVIKRFGKEERKPIREKLVRKPVVKKPVKKMPKPVVVAIADTDNDGVKNKKDICNDSITNIKVDENGCSLFQKPIEDVYFKPDEAKLLEPSIKSLDKIVVELLAYPNIKVEVQAHTDNRGSVKDNLKLSNARAYVVHNYLVSKGVSAERLTKKGYGESKPVANNMYKAERAKNRRVELKIIKKND